MKRRKSGILLMAGLFLCLLAGCFRTGGNEKADKEILLENHRTDKSRQKDKVEESRQENSREETLENVIETEKEQETESNSGKMQTSRIICWGDSLTFGEGGEGVTYPSVLQEHLPEVEVINYGIQGETAKQIAIRLGLLPMTVSSFTIPGDESLTEVQLWQNGEDPTMMRLGDCGINPCTIAGVEGNLSYNPNDGKYYFARIKAGEAVEVEENTQVVTYGDRDKQSSDVIILFAGTNRAPDKEHVQELIDMERQMLDYIGSDRYVVIGLTSKDLVPDVAEINQSLSQAFGEHFLDIRGYLLESGLKDAGITATDQDLIDIENGEIPSSLRVDVVHGTPVFYRLIGEQVYQKLQELGY